MSDDICYPAEDYLLLGKVGKPHGLQGEVRIVCFSEQPENVATYQNLYLVNSRGEISKGLAIVKSRVQGKGVVVQLETITSRNKADEVSGLTVLVAKSELPEIAENEFYYYQFQGKRVVSKEGKVLGTVEQIFNNGAQDILVVSSGKGKVKEQVLIPVTKSIVMSETEGELIIDLPPGLLDLNKQSV